MFSISTFFASASLSGAFSGLLAYGIIHIKGSRPGWAYIFIIVSTSKQSQGENSPHHIPSQEGAVTALFGLFSFFVLPHSPGRARFLTERERNYVNAQLREDGALSQDLKSDGFHWVEIWRCLKSLHVWLVAIAFFFDGMSRSLKMQRGSSASLKPDVII